MDTKEQNVRKPTLTGDPKLDALIGTPSAEFDAVVAVLPDTYWARYDLSACRLGWELARSQPSAQEPVAGTASPPASPAVPEPTVRQIIDAAHSKHEAETAFAPLNVSPLPGFKVMHRIITPACRANRGDDGCIGEVERDLGAKLAAAMRGYGAAKFHVVVTVERQTAAAPTPPAFPDMVQVPREELQRLREERDGFARMAEQEGAVRAEAMNRLIAAERERDELLTVANNFRKERDHLRLYLHPSAQAFDPAKWQIAPRQSTEKMRAEAWRVLLTGAGGEDGHKQMGIAYHTMLAAAPDAPQAPTPNRKE